MNWQSTAGIDVILKRARMLQDIRAFFCEHNVLEVETPVLSLSANTDPSIEPLKLDECSGERYLHTSPEFAMKRLLAQYRQSIYQVCKVFRKDESGPAHNPEFTMLEWYRTGFDDIALMSEIESLIQKVFKDRSISFERVSYGSLFEEYVGLNPHQCSVEQCRQRLLELGAEIPVGMGQQLNEWLDWCLIQLVFPNLPSEQFLFVYDYPASQAALAKVCDNEYGDAVAKRFELFYGSLELANGFCELTDAAEQYDRFVGDNKLREQDNQSSVAIDQRLISALKHGLPECAGVALGLDRLLMVLTCRSHIKDVVSFDWNNA